MGYRLIENSLHKVWAHDMETKTVSLKISTNGEYAVKEATVQGGESISQEDAEAVVFALLGEDSELTTFWRVGSHPPPH